MATVPPAVLRDLVKHPLTDKGLDAVPGRLEEDRADDPLTPLSARGAERIHRLEMRRRLGRRESRGAADQACGRSGLMPDSFSRLRSMARTANAPNIQR